MEGGCFIKIDEYLPVVCTAIHAGHRLRSDLTNQCLLSDSERLFEEDPYTDDMIMSQPIVLIGLDSRFEYDLNTNRLGMCRWGRSLSAISRATEVIKNTRLFINFMKH